MSVECAAYRLRTYCVPTLVYTLFKGTNPLEVNRSKIPYMTLGWRDRNPKMEKKRALDFETLLLCTKTRLIVFMYRVVNYVAPQGLDML